MQTSFRRATIARSNRFDSARIQRTNVIANASRNELVNRIYKLAGVTSRGRFATPEQKAEIEQLVSQLQPINPNTVSVIGEPAPIDGKWVLVYSSVEAFRSSPFFWAFQQGLVQDNALANAIFRFTDQLPIAEVKDVTQQVSLGQGEIVSRVVLEAWPGIRGVVVTTAKAEALPADTVKVTVLKTGVQESNLLTFLDQFAVPVRDIIDYIRGENSTVVTMRTLFVDDELRVSQTSDGALFIYVKQRGTSI